MCEAYCSASSSRKPVSTFTTPGGTSDACSTSAKLTAQSGSICDASTTQVLPPAIAGATFETRPSRALDSGARIAMTPIGSRMEKLKCDEATGLTELNICWYLSAQPA